MTTEKKVNSVKDAIEDMSKRIFITERRAGSYIKGSFSGNSCHSYMGATYTPNTYDYVGTLFTEGSTFDEPASREVKEDFKRFITGKDSPYNPLIQKLGHSLVITKSRKGNITGMLLKSSGFKFNRGLLLNFFKTCRVSSEHNKKLLFWEKWKMKKGYPGGLVYLMMFHYDMGGNKTSPTHAPIEINPQQPRFNLEVFVNPNHTQWESKFFQSPLSKPGECAGEQDTTFGVPRGRNKFNPHTDLLSKGSISVPTRFYNKYHSTSALKIVTDECIEDFFKGVQTGKYNNYLPKA